MIENKGREIGAWLKGNGRGMTLELNAKFGEVTGRAYHRKNGKFKVNGVKVVLIMDNKRPNGWRVLKVMPSM